jgi:predicted Zn-dependent protease
MPRHVSSLTPIVVAMFLSACSSGHAPLLSLEDEKTAARIALAAKIGTTPEEVQQALDTTDENQLRVATAIAKRVALREGTSNDRAMQAHLQSVVGRLANGIGADPNNFRVLLLKSQQVNAFTPGAGQILVNEGLLQFCQNEAQVAAIMAHEMAHVLMKHPQRQKQIRLASKAGHSMMDEYTPNALQENLGKFLRLGGNATLNGMIRQQEMMADSIALNITVKAGYAPREFLTVLSQLRSRMPQRDRAQNIVYGNHPLTVDREIAVAAKIKRDFPTTEGTRSTVIFDRLAKPYRLQGLKRFALRG